MKRIIDQVAGHRLPVRVVEWGGMMDWLKRMAKALRGAVETGAEAYGSASQPMAPEHAKIMANVLADMTPGLGDIKSGIEGMQAAREGDWLGAGMGALGALPFVPGVGGLIRDMPTPKWNKARGEPSFPVGDWSAEPKMNMGEFRELIQDAQAKSAGNSLRALKNDKTGRIEYAWPEDAALHQDVGAALKLNPADWTHTYVSPPK